jgi:ABC-type nickel/cobalt efflux system permease component RcnA
MNEAPEILLIGAVAAVGVLHTIVPDHWVPITVLARQRGWTSAETARAALQAGTGHVLSTLAIAVLVWLAGAALAARYAGFVDAGASLALVLFGGWIAVSAWRELSAPDADHDHGHHHHHNHAAHDHEHDHEHAHEHEHGQGDGLAVAAATLSRHRHLHRHGDYARHSHWHEHDAATSHAVSLAYAADPPLHQHAHPTEARTALLLILGSSPMVEGIPAFFAAAKYGAALLAFMAAVFAAATIATYVALCVLSAQGLQRASFGPLERYGEVLSGALIAAVGVVFWAWPVL